MLSQTETAGGAGQYGFYAVPKAVEPKKKYRDVQNQYEDEEEEDDTNPFATIDDRQPVNQRQLERDYYVDQAPYPEFKPKQRGLDYGVQIEGGDLFDFDLQVRPLVEIIVGRSVVTAINQLQQEKEKEERSDNLDTYQKKRNAQLMVTQRLEAKHKRKQDEAQRRKLQKNLYVNNQKQAGKKIIARRNAKQALLGFKNDLLNELEDAGYLRAEPTSDLKIKYEEWLYEKIMQALSFKAESERTVEKMINEEEKKIADEHRKAISQEMARRKGILDERERVENENRERKEKKRYKKWRKKLNSQREPEFFKYEDLLEKYEQCKEIMKFGDQSNGFSNGFASRSSIYIAGGLQNFILALIQSSGKQLSAQEIEDLLIKVINESGKEFEIALLEKPFEKVEEVKKRMQEKSRQFMAEKNAEVKDLAQQISLDLTTLESGNVSIKSSLHRQFIEAFLSLYLTIQPQKTEENDEDLNDTEKKRLEYANKIIIKKQSSSFVDRLQNIDEILRVRFEILTEESEEDKKEEKEEEKEEKQEEEQYVDIYDGQGWERYAKTAKRQLNRSEQVAAALNLGTSQNAFIYDERVLHYLQIQLQKLLELEGGEDMKLYIANLCNIRTKVKKDVPVFDSEIKWN